MTLRSIWKRLVSDKTIDPTKSGKMISEYKNQSARPTSRTELVELFRADIHAHDTFSDQSRNRSSES